MKKRVLMVLMGLFLVSTQAFAQQKTVTGQVTDERGASLPGVSVVIKGTTTGTLTTSGGTYSIRAAEGQILQFRFIGTTPVERTIGAANTINVQLRRVAATLDAVVVTALGQTIEQRALGTAQQTVAGADIAGTQRENFVNALQGRIAGVEVVSTSGIPGASSSITIRGVSSISSSNQPLMVIDGLPMDNKTMNTGALASGSPGSTTSFENRGVDFTNRAADLNPEDIESITVLKGPEAAALYGIDAANGAIVITTKKGKPGVGGLDYSNSFRIENVRAKPVLQRTYGPTTLSGNTIGSFSYFGNPYPEGTEFHDNISGFFQTGVKQNHNLTFSGATEGNRIHYRVASSLLRQVGVIPNSLLSKVSLTGRSGSQVNRWLNADLSMAYTNTGNHQSFKGANGPFLGLMLWPQTDPASDYITPAGNRRRITNLAAASETDNPYFNVEKNQNKSANNRLILNFGLTFTPFSWGDIQTKLGSDGYTNQVTLLRHPESAYGLANNGILDQADDITRNLSAQTLLNMRSRRLFGDVSIRGMVGNSIIDAKSQTNALGGRDFLDPNFVSVNNTALKTSRTVISQRRLVSAFGSASVDYKRFLFVTVTGRNDWTSTIPVERNSFFYPSINTSFIFSDAFPTVGKFMTGKIRAGWAEVGKDARPYAFRPSLQSKTTSFGGYGFDFWGPNPNLKPEFKQSAEVGVDLGFLDDRLGLDVTVYRSQTKDQIVESVRSSYGTGFILLNLNGAETENKGLEISARATPIQRANFTWDVTTNFASARGKTLKLPNEFPESYVSDTWLFGNVRNGTAPGLSTMSLTGWFYLRNNKGDLLIDPTSGLPIQGNTFTNAGYDRQPDWTMGLSNNFRYKRARLDFLIDFRRGGDVYNATEQFLTARGLSARTLDRDQPRVVDGVLRDGRENSENPTRNTIVIVPAIQTGYYTGISEELFIEKDINWVRLRDVTLTVGLPARVARNASVFITGTDVFLFTNYSGLDPIANGTSASVGGSGGIGIDYGNFPIPRGINFGLKMGF